jgi:peptidoglycan lytic transglycosylase G
MRLLKWLAVLIAVLVVAAGASAFWGLAKLREPYKGYAEAETFVDIPTGAGRTTIAQRLVDAGVVRDALTFRGAVWMSGRARELKAGEYRFDQPMSALDVVDKIARGDVYRRMVTFREGLTIAEMARVFEEARLGPAADFEKAARDPALIRALDPAARDLEGYLFPETYALGRTTPAGELVSQMVGLMTKALTPEWREAAGKLGLTVREAVTLASLVEKETAVPEERPLVAAVYLNRKKIGMPMQADPTVIYALLKSGKYDGNLRRDDLQFDSPYNTYRYPGLPPGPIAAPGKSSLDAAAHPAAVEYLYFVSKNDGSHAFARTLDEHNRNVQRWQVDYFRQQRQQGAR